MAACGSLQHIFEKPLPENPTLLESLSSWNHHIKSSKPIEDSSFTEIFGELHFKENPESSSPSLTYLNSQSRPKIDNNTKNPSDYFSSSHGKQYNHNNSDSFSSMNSESLQLCTEGLGFESSDDVEDLKTSDWENQEKRIRLIEKNPNENIELKKTRTSGSGFPPPISCIGESGKPCVCFKSYREDGRFVLKEIRIPTQEFLHASREDGRLKLQFFKSDDEIVGEDEEEEEEVDEFDDDRENDEFDGEVDDAEIGNSDGGDHCRLYLSSPRPLPPPPSPGHRHLLLLVLLFRSSSFVVALTATHRLRISGRPPSSIATVGDVDRPPSSTITSSVVHCRRLSTLSLSVTQSQICLYFFFFNDLLMIGDVVDRG